ncbi:MAG: NAD-dependent epimerase/dehydratase family protein [Verrucomicrobiae bacterium]|nr:NAD-dependent epimerase/dehydratase family protein [Verrucomicrobiae bacterium]
MKILLTGASGFVGSHILDRLCEERLPTAVLLRPESPRRFIEHRLNQVEVRPGSIRDPASLDAALEGVSHVLHCAGAVRALRDEDFFAVNQTGTRNVVEAINRRGGQIQRLVHISSLSAHGPATPQSPARENDPPRPVSVYGRSKLAAENEVRERCGVPFVILRPPGVYGPRDGEFLRLFRAVRAHLLPQFGGGRQPLSLVFVRDLAAVAVTCLTHPGAAGKTFFVAAPEVVTSGELAREIASQMNVWTLRLPLPVAMLWPVCAVGEAVSRVRGRASVLSRWKYAELSAPGWVCDATRLREELGLVCQTTLRAGIAETLARYRAEGWV